MGYPYPFFYIKISILKRKINNKYCKVQKKKKFLWNFTKPKSSVVIVKHSDFCDTVIICLQNFWLQKRAKSKVLKICTKKLSYGLLLIHSTDFTNFLM